MSDHNWYKDLEELLEDVKKHPELSENAGYDPPNEMGDLYQPPYYYSHDDRHNEPYISGPWTFEDLQARCPSAETFLVLVCTGDAVDIGGDLFRLHTPKRERATIQKTLEIVRKMEAGEKLP